MGMCKRVTTQAKRVSSTNTNTITKCSGNYYMRGGTLDEVGWIALRRVASFRNLRKRSQIMILHSGSMTSGDGRRLEKNWK